MALTDVLLVLAVIALVLVGIYVFFGYVSAAFRDLGFTRGEASLIVLGSALGGGIDFPLWQQNGWTVAVNVGGALIPLVVVWLLLRRYPMIVEDAFLGVPIVALSAYLVTTPTSQGITSLFPLWLVPPVVAALLSLAAFWRQETHSAPLAYTNGVVGVLIGGDLLHLSDFLAQAPPQAGAVASIGGAAIFDMVFLAGVLAVLVDVWIFRQVQRESHASLMPIGGEHEVYTPQNPPHGVSYSPLGALVARWRGRQGTEPKASEKPSARGDEGALWTER